MPGGVVCQLATFKCSTLESRGSFETKQDALKLAQFLSRFMIFSAGSFAVDCSGWIAPIKTDMKKTTNDGKMMEELQLTR